MKRQKLFLTLTTLLSMLFISCSDIDMMLTDYNDKFERFDPYKKELLIPGDPGFDEDSMLLDTYIVSDWGTINLAAPPENAKQSISYLYEWNVYDVDYAKPRLEYYKLYINTYGMDNDINGDPIAIDDTTSRFVVYVPDSGKTDPVTGKYHKLIGGNTYRLQLLLTESDDNTKMYNDFANLVVYKDYFFYTGVATIPPGGSAHISRQAVSRSVNSSTKKSKSIARCIVGESATLSTFRYYLLAYDISKLQYLEPFEIEINGDADGKTGKIEIDLPLNAYVIHLFALKDEAATLTKEYLESHCTFIANATVDTRYNNSPEFIFLPAPTSQEMGDVELKVYTSGWDFTDFKTNGYTISSELKLEGTTVVPSDLIDLSSDNIYSTVPSDIDEPNCKFKVKQGTYDLVFKFKNSDGTKEFYWGDKIIINGGMKTSSLVALPPLIVDSGG